MMKFWLSHGKKIDVYIKFPTSKHIYYQKSDDFHYSANHEFTCNTNNFQTEMLTVEQTYDVPFSSNVTPHWARQANSGCSWRLVALATKHSDVVLEGCQPVCRQ